MYTRKSLTPALRIRISGLRMGAFVAFFPALLLTLCLPTVGLRAQTTATGSISGRVSSTVTNEYVRNAEVRVGGTNLVTYTGDGGQYSLLGVPAGNVEVLVVYTGYAATTKSVQVVAGLTATHDFELVLAEEQQAQASADTVVKLSKFVVSAERVGNAKAVMDQRAAVNSTNIIATDNFGAITMGNPGEFMKYMPGIVLDYVEPDARGARIGGMDPKYAAVTMDGNRMASGASAGFGGGTRAFEFEQASLNSVEAVEVSKTLTPSMDADSPAGAINMRSKSAFDRKGQVLDVLVSATMNADFGATLKKTQGPSNSKGRKVFPGGLIDYSNIFFNGRFGVQATFSDQREFTQETRSQTNYTYSVAGQPPRLGELVFRPGEKISHRAATSLNLDFKANSKLTFSLRSAFSFFDAEFNNRRIRLTSNLANLSPDSTLSHIVALPTANSSTRFESQYSHRYKDNDTGTIAPKFEFKSGPWFVSGGGSYSKSFSHYEDMDKGFFQRADTQLTRMGWQADRPSDGSWEWTVTQLAGPDWSNPASYLISDPLANNVSSTAQDGTNRQYLGYVDVKRSFDGVVPFDIKVGARSRYVTYFAHSGTQSWTYVGPTGNQLTSPLPQDPVYKYAVHQGGNIDAQNWFVPDTVALYQQYVAHPEYFVPDTIGNLTRRLQGDRGVKEQIDAGYIEASARYKKIRFVGGLRHERTSTTARSIDVLPDATVRAAGYTANTIPFVNYKYRNGEKSSRYGQYDNTFLSGNAKYSFRKDLVWQAGFSQSIYRPDYNNLAGLVSVNETTQVVTIPNPALKPELSNKFSTSLQYYIEPAGVIGLTVSKLWVKDRVGPATSISPEDAGYANDPAYAGYSFLTSTNASDIVEMTSIELEYNQQLTFLPKPFNGLGVFANVSRVITESPQLNVVPTAFNGGVSYRYRALSLNLRGTWTDARVFNMFGPPNPRWEWHEPRTMIDFSATFQINKTYSVIVGGRNIFNSPNLQYSDIESRMLTKENYGALWTFGVKGRF